MLATKLQELAFTFSKELLTLKSRSDRTLPNRPMKINEMWTDSENALPKMGTINDGAGQKPDDT